MRFKLIEPLEEWEKDQHRKKIDKLNSLPFLRPIELE